MVDAGLVHFVASDAHGTDHRPPGLAAARREIARRWGEATASELTEENPRAVVDDRPLGGAQP
jgi:protein-tyrosine phosphatase